MIKIVILIDGLFLWIKLYGSKSLLHIDKFLYCERLYEGNHSREILICIYYWGRIAELYEKKCRWKANFKHMCCWIVGWTCLLYVEILLMSARFSSAKMPTRWRKQESCHIIAHSVPAQLQTFDKKYDIEKL